ncbi:MAG: cysteine peptidase family C39 domain-containing protein, partial [Bacilli bacterium]
MHYFVYQGNDYDCGFACLKMLLCHAHKTSHYLSLQKPVDKRGLYSYKDLIAIARSEGVILCAYTVDDKKEILAYRKRPLLVALYTKMGNLHLVLLKKIGHQKVFIDDPQIGP